MDIPLLLLRADTRLSLFFRIFFTFSAYLFRFSKEFVLTQPFLLESWEFRETERAGKMVAFFIFEAYKAGGLPPPRGWEANLRVLEPGLVLR